MNNRQRIFTFSHLSPQVFVTALMMAATPCLLAHADSLDDASMWLDKMSHALKEQNYQGTLIYGSQQEWHTLSIKHAVLAGMEYEHLLHLTGDSYEILRKGHDVTCVHPGEQAVSKHPIKKSLMHSGLTDNAAGLAKYYRLSMAEGERVADRSTQKLSIHSRDEFRYHYQLWLDQSSGLLLRSELMDLQGNMLERLQFADIDIGVELTEEAFQPRDKKHHTARHITSDHADSRKVGSPPASSDLWQVGWVPRGFMLSAQVSASPKHTFTVMYTDGLAAVSLFVEKVAAAEYKPFMSHRWGATAAAAQYLTTQKGRYRVTVVGEVPVATVKKIALSVQARNTDIKSTNNKTTE